MLPNRDRSRRVTKRCPDYRPLVPFAVSLVSAVSDSAEAPDCECNWRRSRNLALDASCLRHHNVLRIPLNFLNGEVDLKSLLAFAICLAVAIPTLCQSIPGAKEQRQKEQQLRRALEQLRDAIDHYRGMADRGKFQTPVGSHNYPVDLETLVKGVVDVHGKTIKFLEKIPLDPMTNTTDWGLKRAPGAMSSPEGGGIFDVYTKSEAAALDGSKYQDW